MSLEKGCIYITLGLVPCRTAASSPKRGLEKHQFHRMAVALSEAKEQPSKDKLLQSAELIELGPEDMKTAREHRGLFSFAGCCRILFAAIPRKRSLLASYSTQASKRSPSTLATESFFTGAPELDSVLRTFAHIGSYVASRTRPPKVVRHSLSGHVWNILGHIPARMKTCKTIHKH